MSDIIDSNNLVLRFKDVWEGDNKYVYDESDSLIARTEYYGYEPYLEIITSDKIYEYQDVTLFSNYNVLSIRCSSPISKLQIYDTLGKLIISKAPHASSIDISLSINRVFILRMFYEDKVFIKKIILTE